MNLNNNAVSAQNVPTPIRDKIGVIGDRISARLEKMADEGEATDPFGTFMKITTTMAQVADRWLGENPDVKELMTMLADADIRVALKKEIELAQQNGQPILP